MKKVIVLVQSKDIEATLNILGRSGVLHIEHQEAPISENVASLEEKYRVISEAVAILPDVNHQKDMSKIEELPGEILRLVDEKETIMEGLKNIKKNIETWREWGDFDPELIEDLRDKGILIRLCKLTNKEAVGVPEGIIIEELFRKGKFLYCAAITKSEYDLPFEAVDLPERSLREMLEAQRKQEGRIKAIDSRLAKIAEYKNAILSHKKQIESIIEFNKAVAGRGKFEKISYLKGYLPDYNVGLLEKLAQKEKWGIFIEDPDENDNVPTLVKNPGWVEVIKPVFQVIKTLPGYREMDISFWFLIFFSVFFGMLIGDAGYGAIFFLVNLFCHIRFRAKVKDRSIFFLMYVLSICTITWGILTGTFFGQAWLPERIKPLFPFLRVDKNIQAICFLIGAFHLSIAHAWRFIRKVPSLKALSEIGWIFILWGAYFLARSLILSEVFPPQGRWFFISGASLIVLFANPSRNIFKTIAKGAGDFLLHIVNSFTDLVSYIRLFAVGAATVAVAEAFNQMASGIGHGNILAGFTTALILLFGHTLNILLGAMAVLVHGVRLNVLEFSSHLDMEWSGIEYLPFKGKGD